MKKDIRTSAGMMVVVLVVGSLFVPASFAVTADQMLIYEPVSGDFFSKELASDGSGGLIMDNATFDNLGTWSTNIIAFMGDIDGDGFDEMVEYDPATGDFYAKELTSDGSGGLVLSGFDSLGVWSTNVVAFMGDIDGDGFDEMVEYNPANGDFYAKELISDGGGGLVLSGFDNLGVWSTNVIAFMGDIDGDGFDEMIEYNPANGDFYAKELTSDGGGGLVLSGFDHLGTWGTGSEAFMGDIDADGFDEMILYEPSTGNFYSRELIDDGSGGLILDASSQDSLGNWGGPTYNAFMGNLPPANCAELWQRGLGTLGDLNQSCNVDMADWSIIAGKFLTSNVPPVNKLDYYGFYEAKKEATGFYQQARVNSIVRAMGLSGPGFDSIEVMRQFGQGGIGLILDWSTIFRTFNSSQWVAKVDNVKTILQTHDLLQYAVLNYVIDEPHADSSVTNPMVAVIKAAFPSIPTFINWSSNFTGNVTGTTADAVGFDRYVWPNGGAMSDQDYFNTEMNPLIAAMKSEAPGKDIILVSQSGDGATVPFPTPAQMKIYADKAISDLDIRGLLWFFWGAESNFDPNDLDFFKTTGTDAGMLNVGKELLFSQDYETAFPWNLVQGPWDGGEATGYGTTSVPYLGGVGWGVSFGNASATNKRRATEPMSKSVTETDRFSLAFYMQNSVRGNSASNIGNVGLYGTDPNSYNDPFVGVNLGAIGSPREPSFMLQVRIGGQTYQSTAADYLATFEQYYRVEIDYDPNGTFDYRVIDPNTNTVVLSDSYTLSGGTTFSLDAFGISDVNPAADGRTIGVRIDTVNVNVAKPVLINCAAVWAAGLGEPSDLDKDCDVDWVDLGLFVNQWMICDDPVIANCP